MKLWLLRPIDFRKGPWDPWYDRAFGFVIAAETEERARAIATENAGNECPLSEYEPDEDPHRTGDAWTNSALSICEELTPPADEGVVIRDFASA